MKQKFVLLFLLLSGWLGSGCVSMQEYQDVMTENAELKKTMRNHFQTVQRLEKEKQKLARENKALKRENQNLVQQVGLLKKTLVNTQAKYDEIFKKKLASLTKIEGIKNLGKDFQINPKTGGIVLEGDIFFNPGSSTLRSQGKLILRKLVQKLSSPKYQKYEIEIAGHTDSDPVKRTKRKYKDNWWLSCARAYSVLQYMASLGVPKNRLFISGYAFYKPRSVSNSPKSKKLNRRVEIVLHQK
ncbi:MAG: hypothetical protein D6785_08730, partial [Planctomycetota bacterium]